MKFKPLAWDVQQISYWIKRNNLGLFFGALFGLAVFLVWRYQLGGMENIAGHLMYPLFLIFGCTIPFWSILIAISLGALLGAILDSLLSSPRQDKKRAIYILLVLALIFLCLYFYREKVAMNMCTDFNNDGMSDQCIAEYNLGSSSALADNDGDGISNRNECISGTDPTNPHDPGTPCSSNSDCGTNQVCIDNFCEGQLDNGDSCTTGTECISGLCIDNVCSDELNDGDSCSANYECESDLCIEDVCSQPLVDGEPCTANYECESGSCSNGICGPDAGSVDIGFRIDIVPA